MVNEIIELLMKSFGRDALLIFLQLILWYTFREKINTMPWEDIIHNLYRRLKLTIDISGAHKPCINTLILDLGRFKDPLPNHNSDINKRVLDAFEQFCFNRVLFWFSDYTDQLFLFQLFLSNLLYLVAHSYFTIIPIVYFIAIVYARIRSKDLCEILNNRIKENEQIIDGFRNNLKTKTL
jgi:hypothetical protein